MNCIPSALGRARSCVAAGLALALLAASPSAFALTQQIIGTVNGQGQNIGQLDTGVNNRVEEGLFQLGNNYKYLMNDALGSQFRYFQIVTNDPSPIPYLGQPNNAPYADPPSNGWDYQRTPAGNFATGTPGADTSPFYENDDTNATYAFPKYSGQIPNFGGQGAFPVHNAANGYVLTQDVPGYGTNALVNTSLDFYTFITFSNTTMRNNSQFLVLAGYQWGVGRNGAGNYYDIQPTALDLSTDDLQGKVSLALGADGFSGWTALFQGEIVVPEPASLGVIAIAGMLLGQRRRRAA